MSDGTLSRTRYCLREMLPGIGVSRIAEALACGLGFSANPLPACGVPWHVQAPVA